jgi:hypothetical protein
MKLGVDVNGIGLHEINLTRDIYGLSQAIF